MSTSIALVQVPPLLVIVNESALAACVNESKLFVVWLKTPNPSTVPDPPSVNVVVIKPDGLVSEKLPIEKLLALTLTSAMLESVNRKPGSAVNVTVAVVELVKSTVTVPKGPETPDSAVLPTFSVNVTVSAFAREVHAKTNKRATEATPHRNFFTEATSTEIYKVLLEKCVQSPCQNNATRRVLIPTLSTGLRAL